MGNKRALWENDLNQLQGPHCTPALSFLFIFIDLFLSDYEFTSILFIFWTLSTDLVCLSFN